MNEHLKGGRLRRSAPLRAGGRSPPPRPSGSATPAAGAPVTLTLNSTGEALLKGFGRLTVTVVVSSGAKTLDTTTVVVAKAAVAARK